jgi:Na+-driven multidrug efflux pump
MRSIGAQAFCMRISLSSYYILGVPLGSYLMLKTQLRVLGYWMGYTIAGVIISIGYTIFVWRIDWINEAKKVLIFSK